MNIYGIRKLTLLDYPDKTACTLFTGGCNFRCPFCHNASLVQNRCEPMDIGALRAFLLKRRGLLDGVCVTGGEPLMHGEIGGLLAEIKALGYAVKLDTNGAYPDKLQELIGQQLIDYVAMDVKSSPAGYARAVGLHDIDISPVNESIKLLIGGAVDYEFRTTAVKGLHTPEDFTAIGDWIAGAKRYFLQNYADSGDILGAAADGAAADGAAANFAPFGRLELEQFLASVAPRVKFAALRGID